MVDDSAGDTVVDGTSKAKPDSRSDIVQSSATNQPKGIVLTAQTAQRSDPTGDPNWASESTLLSWELDTNNDAIADYEAQLFLLDGNLVAGVNQAGDVNAELVCQAEAAKLSDALAVGFDPACVGTPSAYSYRVSMYYDTNPQDENADVITDVAPNGGWSRPVSRSSA